jgi:hypothetical protein
MRRAGLQLDPKKRPPVGVQWELRPYIKGLQPPKTRARNRETEATGLPTNDGA